jgi:hypothetical protein
VLTGDLGEGHRKGESQHHVETRIKVAENEGNLYPQDMDTSLRSLEEALSIRRQIDTLERRLASLLGGAERATPKTGKRAMSAATKAKLSAAAKARWAKRKRSGVGKPARKRGGLTPAGRKRLSQLMKARWAARKKAAGKK